MKPDDIDDEHLLYIVGQADKELFLEGKDIRQRSWEIETKLMKQFGYVGFVSAGVGKPKILERIEAAFSSIYRTHDMATGWHIGVFMYRDIFARISVPRVYGHVQFNPFKFVELTPVQLRIIQTEPEEIEIFLDQFSDVADIQDGFEQLNKPYSAMELVVRFIDLARLHLHAASAVLTGGYDGRGGVQSALLATELALKAGAAASGLSEKDIKDKFGHHVDAIADFIGTQWPKFDVARVKRVLASHPKYVANRYDAAQPDRRAIGHIVMGTQYLVSEVIRQMSDCNMRADLQPPIARRYPA